MPQPFPHRVSFLATTFVSPARVEPSPLFPAAIVAAAVFDHLISHPVVSLSDFDDDRLADEDGNLLDARHPGAEELVEWHFRVHRRADVLWLEIPVGTAPGPVRLLARRPAGQIDSWVAGDRQAPLSAQLDDALAQWLVARRLPAIGSLPGFTRAELLAAGGALAAACADAARDPQAVVAAPTAPGLAIAALRALAERVPPAAAAIWPQIAALAPTHVVARRNLYLARLKDDRADRRAILAIADAAPMYGKPHLSIWGDAFAADRPIEGTGLHHQGIAATLLPTNPYACHNYSLQLAERGRREESYRWADRATVAAPAFAGAHLDCVRRLRRCGRPGQAFSEAQYRCHEILALHRSGALAPHERALRHHAELLLAYAHADLGRLDEAIALADSALASVPPALEPEVAWARARAAAWRTDPVTRASAAAWRAHHAGDPGQVIAELSRGVVADEDSVAIMIDALIAVGREDLALIATGHYQGVDDGARLGDGKARLAAAKAHLLCGDAATALEHVQIVQLRRPQSRLEAEVNRVLRLAACRPAAEWDAVLRRRLASGATSLARMAARDLADFVPGISRGLVTAALGADRAWRIPDAAIAALVATVPEAARWAAAIVERLRPPPDDTLESADRFGQEWWSVLVPPAVDRDGHAASALLAFGVAIARYLERSTHAPSPLCGAYRHIATEALHLVRRARYQISDRAVRGLLEMYERCAEADGWLRDTWLLRIERALDLDHEHGALLEVLTQGLPATAGLLRGDERIGWELRFAFELARDASQLEPASFMFERALRGAEGGTVPAAWSRALAIGDAPPLDALWTTALAAQHAEPWANLARAAFAAGRHDDGFDAACRSAARATAGERAAILGLLGAAWPAALDVPVAPAAALAAGLAALAVPAMQPRAERCLRWAAAADPSSPDAARALAAAHARAGRVHDCVRALAAGPTQGAPPAQRAGRLAIDAGRDADAVLALRYAALAFTTAADWRELALAARRAGDNEIAAHAYQRCMAAGGALDRDTLHGYVTALAAIGLWKEAEAVADRLVELAADDPVYRAAGLHALAVALAGQNQFTEAATVARAAVALDPASRQIDEIQETLRCIEARQGPPVERGPESSVERRAWDALAAGDPHTPEQLAQDANSWGLARAALAAVELRRAEDTGVAVPGRVLEAAVRMLDRTAGATAADAVVCRLRALRIRENAFIQIDPPPPGPGATGARDAAAELAER